MNAKIPYAYIIASTLNQMVNYIPLRIKFDGIQLSNIYNITLKKKRNGQWQKITDNKDWDKNLKGVISNYEIRDIEIEQRHWRDVEKTSKAVKNAIKNESKPIFWNITGGQRPFLLAVFEITKDRPNDIIAYLEGNTGKIVMMKHDKKQSLICISDDKGYQIEGLTIEIALKLMGFDVSKDGKSRTEGFETLKNHLDKDFFINLTDKVCANNKLRLELIKTNKPDKKQTAILAIKNDFSTVFTNKELATIKGYLDKKTTYPFGYMLEYMAAFKILANEEVVKQIADMNVSASLYFTDKEQQKAGGSSSIDEFDIAILTKTGQLIVIECKSGGMSGDVGKSTKYSTYAAAGVYGKPILITPLKRLEKHNLDSSPSLDDELFNKIKSASRSASRATLEVWGIDEIENKIAERLRV